jgi:hypothetical protein
MNIKLACRTAVGIAIVALSVACSAAPVGDTPMLKSAAAHAAAKHSSLHFVEARTKGNAPSVSMRYSVPESIPVNANGIATLEFSNVGGASDAHVEVRSSLGVSLSSLNLSRGETRTLEVTVTSATDGVDYLDVFMSEGTRSSATSVPLHFGSGKPNLKQQGKLTAASDGKALVTLPARLK